MERIRNKRMCIGSKTVVNLHAREFVREGMITLMNTLKVDIAVHVVHMQEVLMERIRNKRMCIGSKPTEFTREGMVTLMNSLKVDSYTCSSLHMQEISMERIRNK